MFATLGAVNVLLGDAVEAEVPSRRSPWAGIRHLRSDAVLRSWTAAAPLTL